MRGETWDTVESEMNILIVDDSTAMRMMIIRTLRQAGLNKHDFSQAEDGEKGLTYVRDNSPDLVLADWNMPNMTGIEMLEAIREEGIDVKTGFITTEATASMRARAAAAGALFLVAKPFTVESFEQALAPVLGG
jgi:two-component system chemotaxis response regulator CheY